ncbi:PREDICTED: basic proline-rich protein-like [Bison bison bison]|uniref:Basic proline-rich protein-like n=1 Tax=Bison bison bison TaxID=43346 RepID=A0A6P3IHG5_BISBB|nr:PREDICTED: basic proline-rich protein-like [Bison bison bison]
MAGGQYLAMVNEAAVNIHHLALRALALAHARDKSGAKGRKVHSGFSDRPPVRLGRLRRPVPGGGSGPGFARARRPPPGAGAPGRGASRRLVIAGARRPLGPRVLRCPRARPGAPPIRLPRGRDAAAPAYNRDPPQQAPRRPPPTRAPRGHCGEPDPSARELSALRRPRPPSAEEAPANGAAWAPERRRRAAGGCRGSLAARLTPRLPPSEGLGSRLGAHVPPPSGPRSCGEDAGSCWRRLGGAPPCPSPRSSDTAPAPPPPPPPSPGGARTLAPSPESLPPRGGRLWSCGSWVRGAAGETRKADPGAALDRPRTLSGVRMRGRGVPVGGGDRECARAWLRVPARAPAFVGKRRGSACVSPVFAE